MTTPDIAEALPNVAKTAPERIWLVIGEGCPPEADFTDCDEVTWCQDKIDTNSIGYVRADAYQMAAEKADRATASMYGIHYALKDAGWHPGRTDDKLTDIIRARGVEMVELKAELERLRAQVAPLRVVTEEMHVAACKVLTRANGLDGLPQRMLDAMLAASPTAPAQRAQGWPDAADWLERESAAVYGSCTPGHAEAAQWLRDTSTATQGAPSLTVGAEPAGIRFASDFHPGEKVMRVEDVQRLLSKAQPAALAEPVTPTVEDINAQQWAGMDGAIAFHLIERHGENWNHVGRLMEAWRAANAAPSNPPAQAPAAEPLTYERAAAIFKAWRTGPLWLHVVRETERAHGIGADSHPQPADTKP